MIDKCGTPWVKGGNYLILKQGGKDRPGGPVVKTSTSLPLALPLQGAGFQSLVEEPRSHVPHVWPKNKK